MKSAIMQPYFFPYLGYWQLINAVDKFVLLDDVNYIMRGYINRNSILVNGSPYRFTISIDKPSQNKLINETKLFFPTDERKKLLKAIEVAYKKAPYFEGVYPMIQQVILYPNKDLVSFLKNSICTISNYLSIDTDILVSSEIPKDVTKKSKDRIIEINKCLGSDIYINATGGQSLYNREEFKKAGIDLFFIKMIPFEYKQFNNKFVPNLSVIDVLMFNCLKNVNILLRKYLLV